MRVDLTKLPVGPEEKKFLDEYVQKQIGERVFNLGGIHHGLRDDYLNSELPLPDRAMRHFGVTADEWRSLLDAECWRVIREVSSLYGCDMPVVYPWRAGLAFLRGFCDFDFPCHLHLGISRDEKNPTKTARKWLPFDDGKKKTLVKARKIVIADIMVATGGSLITTIEEIFAAGARPSQIIVAAIISAPEGIWRVLSKYPEVEIITAVLDNGLNEAGYIYPGLGDAGDKFFHELPLEYFNSVRHAFSASEWGALRFKCV
ncbi:MAG: uracil phosphoribosyltransferase [bacterium]|nr:uracil phosphoribosyltransferase [bacterium]